MSTTKIIWAFDPFGPVAHHERMGALLQCWGGRDVAIEAVHVLSARRARTLDRADGQDDADVRDLVLAKMRARLDALALRNLAPPAVLESPSNSTRVAARTLAAHARTSGAALVAVSTRATSGVTHLVLGSFAETLVLQSDFDVLTITPEAAVPASIEHILFPTDLGEVCAQYAVETVAPLAAAHGARLTLLHSTDFFREHPEAGFTQPSVSAAFEARERARQRDALETLAERVRAVTPTPVEAVLHVSQPSIADDILAEADQRHVSLLALVSQKEGLEVSVLGSVTRDVLRRARVPTLTRHIGASAEPADR